MASRIVTPSSGLKFPPRYPDIQEFVAAVRIAAEYWDFEETSANTDTVPTAFAASL